MTPRRRLRNRDNKPLTLADRLLFGSISAVIGAVIGFVGCLVVALFIGFPPPLLNATLLSAGYFFCVGVLRGADAGTHVGEALSVVAALGTAHTDSPIDLPGSSRHSSQWTSFWVLAPWVLGMIVLFVTQ